MSAALVIDNERGAFVTSAPFTPFARVTHIVPGPAPSNGAVFIHRFGEWEFPITVAHFDNGAQAVIGRARYVGPA